MLRYLIYQAKNLIMLPVRLVTSPKEAISGAWSESSRNKALILGLPALIVAGLAGLAIGSVQLLNQENLLDHYTYLYEKSSSELGQLEKDLARQQNVKAVGNAAVGISDEQKVKLKELRESRKIYLDKLIELDPDNDVHRFNLARLVYARGDQAHAFSILEELAPEDAPGYPDAHFNLAKRLYEQRFRSQMERIGNLNIAKKHIDHILTVDDSRLDAKLMLAKIQADLGKFPDAYKLYEELFELNPNFFREMSELNKRMGRDKENVRMYVQGLKYFDNLLDKDEHVKNDKRWIGIETGIAELQRRLKRFADSEDRLTDRIKFYASDRDGAARRVFLKRLLALTYVAWGADIANPAEPYDRLSEDVQRQLLGLYSKAFKNHRENNLVLQSLARLSLSKYEQIATQARDIYDPDADLDAPAGVLNQLGNYALGRKDFTNAIRHYERARAKAPRDPAVLNNLAFSYLVEDRDTNNSERALQLINEAIRNLPNGVSDAELSKFWHTRATALKQRDRLEEALAEFERALGARPNHLGTLQSLIKCYEGLNKRPPERYVEAVQRILAEQEKAAANGQ